MRCRCRLCRCQSAIELTVESLLAGCCNESPRLFPRAFAPSCRDLARCRLAALSPRADAAAETATVGEPRAGHCCAAAFPGRTEAVRRASSPHPPGRNGCPGDRPGQKCRRGRPREAQAIPVRRLEEPQGPIRVAGWRCDGSAGSVHGARPRCSRRVRHGVLPERPLLCRCRPERRFVRGLERAQGRLSRPSISAKSTARRTSRIRSISTACITSRPWPSGGGP